MPRQASLYLFLLIGPSFAIAQIAGQNVNMVSGTQWPNGDPFLQRQNEPSLAVSSRNPLHLLAGANDYRTVDLPGLPVGETGDAWLGIFKSYDGGQSWISTVHPGCRQNVPQCAGAPALKGFSAAADPVVRPGTNGMFYYSGIAFTRAAKSSSVVFVSRFIDNNNEENGDPIKFIDSTAVATAAPGTFVDKPWLAVDVPRSGAGTCTIQAPQLSGAPVSQTFAAGNLYLAYTTFVNEDQPPSQVMFTRSADCGVSWSNPIGLSDTTVNQGAAIAIDPVSGAVYVAWRRFKNGTLGDALFVARSIDGGKTFGAPVQVAAITSFDQATSGFSFRTNDYPTMTVDAAGRVYMAWSQRNAGQDASHGDARIVLSTSRDGQTWTTPTLVNDFAGRGHQFMPSITFAGGKVVVVFYDLRDDNTVGNFTALGSGQYLESRVPAGDLATIPPHPEKVFTAFILDAAPAFLLEGGLLRRHTVDVWSALADPADVPKFQAARVSQYEFGSREDSGTIEQLQVDPPGFPLFSQGTEPFFGDYLDVAAAPTIVPGSQPGTWRFNTDPSSAVSFHAVWTDNRDVRPPSDGDWTHYTPPTSSAISGTSIFDPTQPEPLCVIGQTGMRNQNIYTANITQGLVIASPSNAKTLGAIQRSFPVVVQNTSSRTASYRLTISNQPAGGKASFLQFPVPGLADPLTTLDISVAPASSASRMVFVNSSSPAALVVVSVAEIAAPGAPNLLAGGLTGSVVLNPDPLNPDDPATSTSDIFNPAIANPAIANPAIANPDIANPAIANPAIANPAIANPDIANLGAANPDIANPAIANPAIANPAIANPDIANAAITDATWPLSNAGTAEATYSIHFLIAGLIPPNVEAQLIITRVYRTPVANGCNLVEQSQPIVVTNTPNPEITLQATVSQSALGRMLAAILRGRRMPATRAAPPRPRDSSTTIVDITDSSADNTTITVGPGETVYVTLRFFNSDKTQPLGFDPATDITTITISQSANTGSTQPPIASSRLFAASGTLPPALPGAAYDASLQASGGTTPYTFTLTGGSLPPGLSLNQAGEISGTPTGGSGVYGFTVQVTDNSQPSASTSESLSITVTSVALAVTGINASAPGGSTARPGDTISVSVSIANSGSAATSVSPVIGVVSTGTASATCGAPSPGAADLATGAGQTFTLQCSGVSGAGTLAFSASISATDSATGASVSVGPVTSGAIAVGGTPPAVSVAATAGGAPYASGSWTNQAVTVTFTCTPAGGTPNTQTMFVAGAGANQSVNTTCTDTAGNLTPASFGGINIDATPPVITASATANGAPYSGSPVNQSVTVTFTCTDSGGSGVASVTAPATFSNSGLNQSATGTCTDKAGNTSTTTFSPINIIAGQPQMSVSMTAGGSFYSAGAWTNQPVTVTFSCTVAGGLAPQSLTSPVTVGQGANQFVTGTCVDPAGNQAQLNAGPINVNTGSPKLVLTSTPPAAGSWSRTAVTITWQCSDSVDGTSQTISKTVSSDGANQTVTATCTNQAGASVTASQTVSVDTTPPSIHVLGVSPAPNSAGWNSGPVTVTWSCTDAVSGPVSGTVSQTVSQNGAGQSATGTCTDAAGNSAMNTQSGINIDSGVPVVTASPSSPPNGNGWWRGSVTITFQCTESVSGVATAPQPQTFSSNVSGGSATGTCISVAGKSASATYSSINIDTTAPVIAPLPLSPTPGGGWNNTPVTVSWACSDTVSGPVAGTVSQTLGAEGAGQSSTGTCADKAGNQASNTQTGINIDMTPPQIEFVSPRNGFTYPKGATIGASYSCSDGLSTVASCSGDVPSGTTMTLGTAGTFSFTVTAVDHAGNRTTVTHSYTVQ